MACAMIIAVDTDKFKEFLKMYTEECTSKSDLYENFKEGIPNLNEGNLFDKLTEKYLEILKTAANKPDKRRNNVGGKFSVKSFDSASQTIPIQLPLKLKNFLRLAILSY